MPTFTVTDLGPKFTQMVIQSMGVMLAILRHCGVDEEKFMANADSDIPIMELKKVMGSVWVMHARASALVKQYLKKIAEEKKALESVYASAYSEASVSMPKATETAKKNWIIENFPNIVESERSINDFEYMVGMCDAARKALEIRSVMLQSVNKLTVSELEHLHVHLDEGEIS